MGDKRLSEVIDFETHIAPYRIVEIVSGVGSGKNYWVENVLMPQMRVLLLTSRKAKVLETKSRLGISNCLNLSKRAQDACEYFFSLDRKDGSCICSNGQIEYYMKNRYVSNDASTHLWQFFDIIIIDEAHSLATDATYSESPFYVLDFIRGVYSQSSIPIVLMTATPDPIKDLKEIKEKLDYHYWDFTSECRNLTPSKLWYRTTESALQEMVFLYKACPDFPSKWIYFATRTSTIANRIVPYLVDAGVPEDCIAVSFRNDEAIEQFSETIQRNKTRTEEYLTNHEDLPEDIKFFITTSRNKEGINIDNENYYWTVAIESHWTDEVEQMWGRVRSSLCQEENKNKPALDIVTLVHDASQHTKIFPYFDLMAMLSTSCVDTVNATFREWCSINYLPSRNRIHDTTAKTKIEETISKFPYLRYSVVMDKFCLYEGRILGLQSFAMSVSNYEDYVADWLGEKNVLNCTKPFPIESFLILPNENTDTLVDYITEKGYLDGVPLSKQDKKELLAYISDTLMVRQQSNSTLKYNTLAKALSIFGYTTKECSHHKDSPLYDYVRIEKIKNDEGEDFDLLI